MARRAGLMLLSLAALLPGEAADAQRATPSRPFLERNAFFLESAGFKARFANSDEATRKALRAMPPHRFVLHTKDGVARYVYADPGVCNCIFVGSRDAYLNYRDIVAHPKPGVDDVAPDYGVSAVGALEDPIGSDAIDDPNTLADYLRDTF